MEALLKIENLSIDFVSGTHITHAVAGVSLNVHKGEIVALVGESGSGKSVTALSLLQLLPAPPAKYANGKILFFRDDGFIDLLTLPIEGIQQIRGNLIGMVFQEPMTSLNPVLTCGTQVAEAIRLHKKKDEASAREATLQLFSEVNLPDPERMYHSYPHQLSGGQKQRVMIAMAMSCRPQLLICDEPTTALDVTVQKNILTLIKNLQEKHGMGVIFISHDLGVVSEIADRIIVMYKGRIVEEGATRDILLQPQHPYTRALLSCRPGLYRKGERLPVVADFLPDEEPSTVPSTDVAVFTSQPPQRVSNPLPVIQVEHLRVWFPAKKNFLGKPLSYTRAVDDVSFNIYEGETVGLVGESGCGKTTLGRTILGLIPPTSGSIHFKGKRIDGADVRDLRRLRKDMQIIFQDPYSSLNPRKKVGEAIEEPLKVHRIYPSAAMRHEKVIELLEKVNLQADHYDRYPHEFSGGQRQRIVIARALALQPSFVVCDESVSALDVSVQAQVLNLLNDLKNDFQFTALFISHDLSVIRYISDRIIVMNKGMIAETGTAEEIYHHPTSPYTQQLIESIPGPVRP